MKKGIISLCLLCTISAFAQETTKLTAGKHNEYGLIYSLPKTVFDIGRSYPNNRKSRPIL